MEVVEASIGSFHKLWKLAKASMEVVEDYISFHGSLWGLVGASTAIDAREYLETFPVRSRAVMLVKSQVGFHHRLVCWCESLRGQAKMRERRGLGSYILISRRHLD